MDAAAKAEERLREAIDVLPEGIVFLDRDGRYVLWNQRYAEIYAKSADLLAPGVRLADTLRIGIARGDYPEATGREEAWLAHRLSLLENPGVRHEQRLSNGKCILIEERKTRDGGTIGLRVDITELKEREESFRLLFDDNPVPLLVYDLESEAIVSANDAAIQHFGYDRAAITGLHASKLFAFDEWDRARTALTQNCLEKDRFWHQRACDGTQLESMLFTRQTSIGGRQVAIVSIFDVTERRQTEARMAHMARHDELTGLANRAHCREHLRRLLANRDVRNVTIALLDLDHFKSVNDTYGHQMGDAVLAVASRRMLDLIPRHALLCRIGGDEFAIIFDRSSMDQIRIVANSIVQTMALPFFLGDHVLHIGATVGLASSNKDSKDPETLLRYADLALYAAKANRRGSLSEFDMSMDRAAQERASLEADLREALQKGQIEVHYQPLINLESGAIEGYEALARWTHPQRGAVPPDKFIPLAEEMGLIDQLGQFVLHTACRDAVHWDETITLSVNVSPLQFRNGLLLNTVMQALGASGLPPERLELEITEAVLLDKGTRSAVIIRTLRNLGIGISMDDFGTGYSSLKYLLSYPFTKIKIDQSFVMSLEDNEDSREIVRAIIGIGKSLNLKVTAEGVEQATIRDYLRSEGCSQGQGYLFGKAQKADTIWHEDPKAQVA